MTRRQHEDWAECGRIRKGCGCMTVERDLPYTLFDLSEDRKTQIILVSGACIRICLL